MIISEWSADTEGDSFDLDSSDIESDPLDEKGEPLRASFDVPLQMKNRRMVDDAIDEMWGRVFKNRYEFVMSTHFAQFEHELRRAELVEKEAYHVAVDAYFRIYRGRKRGRPRLGSLILSRTAELSKAGKNDTEIAEATGLDPKAISKDLVRKRVKKALSEERKQ